MPNTPENFPDYESEEFEESDTEVHENPVQYLPGADTHFDSDEEGETPDIDLTDRGTMYLIEERIENLREKIDITFDEILELRELEAIYRPHEENSEAIPEGLGVPSKEDQFIAAMEGKRVNRYDDAVYDGGEIDEEDEVSESSVNRYYQNLLKESRLNLKSISLLSGDRKPLYHFSQNGKRRELTLFDLYETLPPKYTFEEYLSKLWQVPEAKATEEFQKISEGRQYALKTQWEKYLEDRTLNAPSSFQKILFRCQDFVTSPVYDGVEDIKEDHYKLTNGTEFRFTDKTVVFSIPFSEFEDIPPKDTSQKPGFLEAAFILPEYAYERKRFFKKGGTVDELLVYLNHLGVEISEKQTQFLNDLAKSESLRLYHEVLELPDRDEIRGYFLNIKKYFGQYSPAYIEKCVRERLKQEELIVIRQVTQFTTWFPEWMRKIGGIVIESKSGEPVSLPKPLQIGVDNKLPEYSVKREPLFIPSERLLTQAIPQEEWQNQFVAEMRTAYKTNPNAFLRYAKELDAKRIELRCSCDNHGTPHKEKCPVPVLEGIFRKIREERKKLPPTPA